MSGPLGLMASNAHLALSVLTKYFEKMFYNNNNNNNSSQSREAPQENTYKPQIVHRISENKMKIQGTGVKCEMKQSKQVFHKMSKTFLRLL